MTTGRVPRPDVDDLAVTHDELAPVDVEAGDDARRRLDAAYFDRDPRTADLESRVTALELGNRRGSLLHTWAARALSFLAGSAAVALAWVIAKADANGDARATAREREVERVWLRDTVRVLERRDAIQQGQIDGLTDRLRYPMQGPPVAPRTSP